MKLILTEKPDVARKFASALDCKKNDYGFINSDYVIVTCRGHLLTVNSEECGSNLWKLDKLPFLPDELIYIPIDYWNKKKDVQPYLDKISTAFKVNMIDEIIIATDAGREGELIAQLVLDYCLGSKKDSYKYSRFWVSGVLNKENILSGLQNLRTYEDMYGLIRASYLRSYMDWLIGMNLTEGTTDKLHSLFKLGRLIIPAVCEIYNRNKEIEEFVPSTTYTIGLNVEYQGKVLTLDSRVELGDLTIEKVREEYPYSQLIYGEVETKSEIPSKLFSLITMQQYMYRNHKTPLQVTHDILDKLYNVGMLSYPRTSATYLDESNQTKGKVAHLMKEYFEIIEYPIEDITKKVFSKGKLIFNDVEVNKYDHHALLINGIYDTDSVRNQFDKLFYQTTAVTIYKTLLHNLIKRSMDYPRYEKQEGVFQFKNKDTELNFSLESLNIIDLGYYNYPDFQSEYNPDDYISYNFSEIEESIKSGRYEFIQIEHTTRPPHKYNEGNFISWFDKNKIGTQSTIASTIAKLIETNYIYIDNFKNLYTTDKGDKVVQLFSPYKISKPEFTGEMETTLGNFELLTKSEIDDQYMKMMKVYQESVIEMITFLKSVEDADRKTTCKCGNPIDISKFKIECPTCGYSILKKVSGVTLDDEQITKLVKGERIFVKGLYSKAKHKRYNAFLQLEGSELKFSFN